MESVSVSNSFHELGSKIMETSGETNKFHEFWFLKSPNLQAIVPEIMETLETIGVTNVFHGFCYQFHETLMFSQRRFAKKKVLQCR